MKKLVGALATLIAIVGAAGICEAQELSIAEQAYVDSLMLASYKTDEPGAAILIARGGKAVFRKAYGLANLELQIPNRPEYVFRIGSISKQFMAVCILQLAEEGKLSLEDDIREHLPDYDTHDREITIEHLLTHTSGIPSYTEKSDFMKKAMLDHSKDEMVEYFEHDALMFEPGSDWSYSNSGYMLVGLIVEKLTGMTLEDYMQDNIFEPLGMSHTYTFAHEGIMPGAVSGYEAVTDTTVGPASYLSRTWPYGGGLILSSVDDMFKWNEALYTDSIVSREWLERAWTPFKLSDGRSTNYGFGWGVGEYRDMRIISHGGGINGFLSGASRIPSRFVYVVVLSNTTAKGPGEAVDRIALRLSGTPRMDPVPVAIDAEALEEYVGVYALPRVGGRVTSNMSDEAMYRYVSVSEKTLFSQNTGGAKQALTPTGEDRFAFESGTIAQFHRADDGQIASVEIFREPTFGPTAMATRTDLPLPAEKTSIALDRKLLEGYCGKYDFGGGFTMTIFTDGPKVFAQATGQGAVEIYAETENRFFMREVDGSVDFLVEESGKVTGLTLMQGGKFEAKKLD